MAETSVLDQEKDETSQRVSGDPKYYSGTMRRHADGTSDNDYAYVWDGPNPMQLPCQHLAACSTNCGHPTMVHGECPYELTTQCDSHPVGPQYFELETDIFKRPTTGTVNKLDMLTAEGKRHALVTFANNKDKADLDKTNELMRSRDSDGNLERRGMVTVAEDGQNKLNCIL